MLDILIRKYLVPENAASPSKFYPHRNQKVALADAIVEAFPALADSDGTSNQYFNKATTYGFITTKLNTLVKKNLTPSRKKQAPRKKKESSCNEAEGSTAETYKKTVARRVTLPKNQAPADFEFTEEQMDEKIKWMKETQPLPNLKQRIKFALEMTFNKRREWMSTDPIPSFYEVHENYPHLISYGSDMIDAEFQMLYSDHVPLCSTFGDVTAAALMKYLSLNHNSVCKKASTFDDASVKAIFLIAHTLSAGCPPKLTKEEKKGMAINKAKMSAIHSSALVQIVPDGTDVDSYESSEKLAKRLKQISIPPFLLWVTSQINDGGDFFIRIDRKTLFINTDQSVIGDKYSHPIVRALDILFKVYHVFDLKYHPYLHHFFTFLEILYNINRTMASPTVQSILTFIREYKKKLEK